MLARLAKAKAALATLIAHSDFAATLRKCGNGRKRKDFPASQEHIPPSWTRLRTRLGTPASPASTASAGPPGKPEAGEMAPQELEIIESAPGNGMAPAAPCPQDLVGGRSMLRQPLLRRLLKDALRYGGPRRRSNRKMRT